MSPGLLVVVGGVALALYALFRKGDEATPEEKAADEVIDWRPPPTPPAPTPTPSVVPLTDVSQLLAQATAKLNERDHHERAVIVFAAQVAEAHKVALTALAALVADAPGAPGGLGPTIFAHLRRAHDALVKAQRLIRSDYRIANRTGSDGLSAQVLVANTAKREVQVRTSQIAELASAANAARAKAAKALVAATAATWNARLAQVARMSLEIKAATLRGETARAEQLRAVLARGDPNDRYTPALRFAKAASEAVRKAAWSADLLEVAAGQVKRQTAGVLEDLRVLAELPEDREGTGAWLATKYPPRDRDVRAAWKQVETAVGGAVTAFVALSKVKGMEAAGGGPGWGLSLASTRAIGVSATMQFGGPTMRAIGATGGLGSAIQIIESAFAGTKR